MMRKVSLLFCAAMAAPMAAYAITGNIDESAIQINSLADMRLRYEGVSQNIGLKTSLLALPSTSLA